MKLKLKGDLLKLPLQKRLQAIEEARRQTRSEKLQNKISHGALSAMFLWSDSRQGGRYWTKVWETHCRR